MEAYPGVLAREIIGRRSYKSDTRSKQTKAQKDARVALLQRLKQSASKRFGFKVRASNELCDDPGADDLDAMLCAVQAAWAWLRRDNAFGAPKRVDPIEGWIAHPGLRSDV
ncbi:MAG: DUF429 domain-containing protein [Caulobacteraceae bacterium]|nr:DUF429 domain-containing protein [Caulobacteraceae bacterium]